jgi:hypothetical protein
MAPTVHRCSPGTALHALLEDTVARDAVVAFLRPAATVSASSSTIGQVAQPGEVQYQPYGGVNTPFEPYPVSPLQVMWETVHTPPPGASDAEVMLHALRAEVRRETTLIVEATLADGYSRWGLLYTTGGVLVAHRSEH